MKLTYRGIDYKSPIAEIETNSNLRPGKYRLSGDRDANKVILIRPIHYYTYRGVSYTKNLIYDNRTKILLDIERQ